MCTLVKEFSNFYNYFSRLSGFLIYLAKYFWSLFNSPNRHFSHVTKSRIFKNLNTRKKVNCNFRGNFLKNHFRHLKLYSNPPSWLARSRCHMSTIWKKKDWSSHFCGSRPFRFWYVKVHLQRRLKSRKTGILLNLSLWFVHNPKIWSIFYERKFV